ncbi:MAG: NAD-binding protein [Candidatus Methanomethylophilaceae archaeon]|nr:NAD-binding protein [Candidatus Methanomethylophilaceae archaeon]
MRVIIIGAGNVGYTAAETLCDVHDVLVVESNKSICEDIKSVLNVATINEDGSKPRVLKAAIESHSAQIIVSTLKDDAVNLCICLMAKRFNPKITTIASINDPDFCVDLPAESVDMIISPDMRTAEKMYRLATMENVTDYEFVDSIGIGAAVYQVMSYHKIVGQVVMDLEIPDECSIFGIHRNGSIDLKVDTMEVHAGDSIYVVGSRKGLDEFNEYMGVKNRAIEFTILGGTLVGTSVAKMLVEDKTKRFVKLVDIDPYKCRAIAKSIPQVLVIEEDFKDPVAQRAEDLFKSDCLLVTSGSDDTNLLMCMSAKHNGSRKVVTRYFKQGYNDIFASANLDTIIGYQRIITNEITRCLLPDDVALMKLKRLVSPIDKGKGDSMDVGKVEKGDYLFFMHVVEHKSPFCNRYLGDMRLPYGIKIVAISRDGGVFYPDLDTMMLENDQLIVFANKPEDAVVKKLFGKDAIPEM